MEGSCWPYGPAIGLRAPLKFPYTHRDRRYHADAAKSSIACRQQSRSSDRVSGSVEGHEHRLQGDCGQPTRPVAGQGLADAATRSGTMSDFGLATVLGERFEPETVTLAALGIRRAGAPNKTPDDKRRRHSRRARSLWWLAALFGNARCVDCQEHQQQAPDKSGDHALTRTCLACRNGRKHSGAGVASRCNAFAGSAPSASAPARGQMRSSQCRSR